jgi:hypothetical protein
MVGHFVAAAWLASHPDEASEAETLDRLPPDPPSSPSDPKVGDGEDD